MATQTASNHNCDLQHHDLKLRSRFTTMINPAKIETKRIDPAKRYYRYTIFATTKTYAFSPQDLSSWCANTTWLQRFQKSESDDPTYTGKRDFL